jgi:hypothetical protein
MHQDFKVELIDEPELCFGFDQKAAFAKDGLLWFGPVDDVQKPAVMRVGVVSSAAGLKYYETWVKQINLAIPAEKDVAHHVTFPGFEAVFSTQWPVTPVCALTISEKSILTTIRIKDRYMLSGMALKSTAKV